MPTPEVHPEVLTRQRRQSNLEAIWSAQNALPLVKALAILLTCVGPVATAIYFYLRGFEFKSTLGLWMCTLGILTLLATRKGNIRLAISLLLWGFWLLFCLWSVIISGIRTPIFAAIPLVIMLSGWLVGMRSAVIMALLSSVHAAFLILAESNGWISITQRQPWDYYFAYLVMFLVSAYVAGYFGRKFREQFNRLEQTSQSLQTQNEALHHSEDRFALFFRTNPLPSMMTRTADGLIYAVNQAWELAFGWQADEVCGKTTLEINFWESPQERRRASAMVSEQSGIVAHACRFRLRDGSVRSYLVSLTRTLIDGELRTVASMLDQTERLRAEEAIREHNAALEVEVTRRTAELRQTLDTLQNAQAGLLQAEKLASLGALVAGISHELNTPVGNALTTASALHDRVGRFVRLTEEGQLTKSAWLDFLQSTEKMCELLERNCNRAAELITSFKQIAIDQTTERRRKFDLYAMVESVIATLRPGFKTTPWVVTLDIPEGIECDSYPGPLGQVLNNLVQNAFVHAFEGRSSGEVVIAGRLQDKDVIELTVRDDGCGMDASVAQHVFDPFFTTRMGQGGSGLGLSISHQIATAVLGGNLQVSSQPGRGSTFALHFPSMAPEPAKS